MKHFSKKLVFSLLSLSLGFSSLAFAEIETCLVRFPYKESEFTGSELDGCLFKDTRIPKEVIIIASSSPVGSSTFNYNLSQKRGTVIKDYILKKSPTSLVKVENIGASTHLMQTALIYVLYEGDSKLSQSDSKLLRSTTRSDMKDRYTLSISLGRSYYHLSTKGTYFTTQVGLDGAVFLDLLPENVFLTPGLSFSYFGDRTRKDLQATYAKLGVRGDLKPIQVEIAALAGLFSDSEFKKFVGDLGIQTDVGVRVSKKMLLGTTLRQTRAFSSAALTLQVSL